MAIVETDLELLEGLLDGALDEGAAAKLKARLQNDNALASALAGLKTERFLRQAAFKSMQPDAATAERLVWRVRGAMHDQKQKQVEPARVWSQWNLASVGSAAAACLLVGFLFGRSGHVESTGRDQNTGGSSNGTNASLVEMTNPGQRGFVAVNHTPQISVPVTNEYGQVVAFQNFDNTEQAKNFTEDLHRTRAAAAVPSNTGATKLVDHEQEVPF